MKRIMIVDDTVILRATLRDYLESVGFQVVAEANDGIEAIKYYKQYKPDLVTMDITMPGMNGIDTLIELKREDPEVKVVMCSSMGQQSTVIRAIKAGAVDFLIKPLHKERLILTVNKLLQS